MNKGIFCSIFVNDYIWILSKVKIFQNYKTLLNNCMKLYFFSLIYNYKKNFTIKQQKKFVLFDDYFCFIVFSLTDFFQK